MNVCRAVFSGKVGCSMSLAFRNYRRGLVRKVDMIINKAQSPRTVRLVPLLGMV